MNRFTTRLKINRSTWNICMFIISFIVSNLVSGIIYDTYINYLQEISLSVATSFWAFYGYATFISAFLLIFISKIGYKKLLICSSISCSIAMVSVIILDSSAIFSISTLLALVGIQLHYVILSPYIATYTNSQNKIRWYTKAYYMGYVGYFLTTLLGGAITVKMFSLRAGETYAEAKILTKYISDMTPTIKSAYLQGNKDVLLVTAIISILAVIPVILIREEKADYCLKENKVSFIEQIRDIFRAITGRYPIIYIIYWALVSFGMGLFSSYYTVFLNRNLHIDKVTSSQLVSL